MAKIDITKTELVWPGKYNEDGARKEAPRVDLPFQIVETINESRATREAKKGQATLFDIWEGKEGDTFEEGWRNKLIWGDNLLVMGSLLEKFAGKINLIYIDPPFGTGADFTVSTLIGESSVELSKEASLVEEKAYRDTWGKGLESYIQMMSDRFQLMRELLRPDGSIYVHVGTPVSSVVRLLLDETFGAEGFVNEISWKRSASHNDPSQFGRLHDNIYLYQNGEPRTFNKLYAPYTEEQEAKYNLVEQETGRRYMQDNMAAPAHGHAKPMRFGDRILEPPRNMMWRFSQENIDRLMAEGRIVFNRAGTPKIKRYLDEMSGALLQDIWTDCIVHIATKTENYPTQKPEKLIDRIIQASSNEGDLIADFFCGSGTTLAVAERLSRRWIGCDLSRWAIHVTRKRLLGIEGCKPFEVLNLGKYERKYWQGVTFGDKKKDDQQLAIFQYIAFILKLYGAEPLAGMQHLHGKKGRAVVHIGAVDAPVTIDEINACIDECLAVKQSELHVLGWEWEMGLANLMVEDAKRRGIKLLLLNIPREVMERQAVEKGDIRFFEVAHLEVNVKQEKGANVTVALKDFAFPYADLIPEDVRNKISKWSDYIDYWAVDWNFQNDTFMNGWVAYRTRKDRTLTLASDPHAYEKPGKYTIMVKVIDIFGNDTSQAFDIEVR